jgi:hypothetical protein
MTTWILILTLVTYQRSDSSSMTNIPGFKTEAQCRAAGQAWLDQMNNIKRNDYRYETHPRAMCVPQPQQ